VGGWGVFKIEEYKGYPKESITIATGGKTPGG